MRSSRPVSRAVSRRTLVESGLLHHVRDAAASGRRHRRRAGNFRRGPFARARPRERRRKKARAGAPRLLYWRVPSDAVRDAQHAPRLLSLDAFRGLTVAAMVLVNNPGTWRAVYPPLRHADWHGWTLTDLVFPFFLFIVGVAIPLALAPRLAREGRGRTLVRVLRRSLVIFALGLLLNAYPDFHWATVRVPGVLQRIAVCYLVAALLFLTTTWRAHAAIAGTLLAGYALVLAFVPAPGHAAGDLTKDGTIVAYVDRALLGPHLWRASRVYDPEGILSTIPAVGTTLIGMLGGVWLRTRRAPPLIAGGLALGGVVGVAAGLTWARWLPINKSLWTSSYVLLTGGLALLALAVLYLVIEGLSRRRWSVPFAVLGVNALALFFLSTLAARVLALAKVGPEGRNLQSLLFERLFASWAAPIDASLAYAVAYLVIWWAVMAGLYRLGVRLRV
jgi:predicted acyltransferase